MTPVVDGFLSIRRTWQPGEAVDLGWRVVPELVAQDARVASTLDRRAVKLGPLVYCAEGVDNDGRSRDLVLDATSMDLVLACSASQVRTKGLRQAPAPAEIAPASHAIEVAGARVREVAGARALEPATIRMIPYFLWANRGRSEMVVWLPIVPELAELEGDAGALVQDGVRIRASHCWRGDTPAALNDGLAGRASGDESIPRLTFWDHCGSEEWVEYEFDAPRRIERVAVQWFDDTGRGRCRVPASWRVLAWNGDAWAPLEPLDPVPFGLHADVFNRARFAPVETRRVRLEVRSQDEFSSGILEWRVE